MNRRSFLNGSAAALGVAATGCTIPKDDLTSDQAACAEYPDKHAGDIFRVDVHCHIMNQEDLNPAAFIVRRLLPPNVILDGAAGLATRSALSVSALGTDTLAVERAKLGDFFAESLKPGPRAGFDAGAFCTFANEEQIGLFLAGNAESQKIVGSGRTTGFASSRLRNAAVLMANWPEIDIFMPLMVDLYEGRRGGSGEHPCRQAEFYRDLNCATRGRFLPLVSYNPERQVLEGRDQCGITNLDLVKRAVDEWGFVGVKLHPTAGFNPIDNALYGCPNTALQLRTVLTEIEGRAYDRAMQDLYDFCESRDVPIITHGSDSLSAHEACMQGTPERRAGREGYGDAFNRRFSPEREEQIRFRDPATWTNAPAHWVRVLETRNQERRLRVALAHYASRFQDHSRGKLSPRLGGYSKDQPRVEYDDGKLVPSAWLERAMAEIRKGGDGVWLDMSHLLELAYSAAILKGEKIDRDGLFGSKVQDKGRYAKAFKQHLRDNDYLLKRIMYGSDHHMPEVSRFGRRYRDLIEDLVPEASREDVMGGNAARFFGLAVGRDGSKPQNRQRLEAFYERQGVAGQITWMDRMERRGIRADG
ncbi:MAG: hypothetical protein AAF192_12080 [Pseudomonadota bacterium]